MFDPDKYQIVEKIKNYIKEKDEEPSDKDYYVMLRNGHILDIFDYHDMVNDNKINPSNAYAYIGIGSVILPCYSIFYYPFLESYQDLLLAYLSRLGFYYEDYIVPATGLKYVVDAIISFSKGSLSIEVVSLDTAVSNTNLRKIVFETLHDKIINGGKELTEEEYCDIYEKFGYQRLFGDYNFVGAGFTIFEYFKTGKQSLMNDVVRIVANYNEILKPYKVCFEIITWNQDDCPTFRL